MTVIDLGYHSMQCFQAFNLPRGYFLVAPLSSEFAPLNIVRNTVKILSLRKY